MNNAPDLERRLMEALRIKRRPVAVSLLDSPPDGVSRFEGTVPSGCSFWRLAAEGRVFYTVPGDHYNCAVGSYTLNIALPEARAEELDRTLSFMIDTGYLKMEDVAGMLRLPSTPGAIVYAPLAETPTQPDVVLFAGPPGRLMLLNEAALRAKVFSPLPLLARPTCMALPAAMAHGTVASAGCIGNRVYTDLGDDELYVAVPGRDLEKVADEIQTISSANAQLRDYHQLRRQTLATQ